MCFANILYSSPQSRANPLHTPLFWFHWLQKGPFDFRGILRTMVHRWNLQYFHLPRRSPEFRSSGPVSRCLASQGGNFVPLLLRRGLIPMPTYTGLTVPVAKVNMEAQKGLTYSDYRRSHCIFWMTAKPLLLRLAQWSFSVLPVGLPFSRQLGPGFGSSFSTGIPL